METPDRAYAWYIADRLGKRCGSVISTESARYAGTTASCSLEWWQGLDPYAGPYSVRWLYEDGECPTCERLRRLLRQCRYYVGEAMWRDRRGGLDGTVEETLINEIDAAMDEEVE